MPATFDGPNKIITLPPVVGGVLSVDIGQDLYSPWKEWALSGDNLKYEPAFRSDGGAPLTGVINQGSYFFLNNEAGWRIRPAENDGTYTFIGNLALEDTESPALVPTVGDFTVAVIGLQPVTQGITPVILEQLDVAAFGGAVWIESLSGNSGVEFPSGTYKQPVDNLTDAQTIRISQGINRLNFIGDFTFQSGDNVSQQSLYGQSRTATTLTFNSGSICAGTEFFNASIEGSLISPAEFTNCTFLDIIDTTVGPVETIVASECTFTGTVTLSSSLSGQLDINQSVGARGGGLPAIFDINGADIDAVFSYWSGKIEIRNATRSGKNIEVDMVSGSVNIADSCTDGTIILRGIGSWENENTYSGTATVINGLVEAGGISVDASAIADAVWDEAISDHTAVGSTGLSLSTASSGGVDVNVLADAVWSEPSIDHNSVGTMGYLQNNVTASVDAATIADAVWDENLADHLIVGSAGAKVNDINILDAATIADVVWDETLADHTSAGTTGEKLDAGSTVDVSAIADAVWDETLADHTTAGSTGAKLDAGSTVDVSAIADAVWDEALADHLTIGSVGAKVNDINAPDAATIADAVWDESLADHTLVGTTGEKLDAGSTVDTAAIADAVWDEPLGDHTTAGTAGLGLSTASSGGVDVNLLADAVWDEAAADHNTVGSMGYLQNNVTASVDAATIADAVWDEPLDDHLLAGSTGASLASGGGGGGISISTGGSSEATINDSNNNNVEDDITISKGNQSTVDGDGINISTSNQSTNVDDPDVNITKGNSTNDNSDDIDISTGNENV